MVSTTQTPTTSFCFRKSFKLSCLIVSITLLVLTITLPLIPTHNPNRTETIFVYGTLKNPWIRTFACHCRTAAIPTTLSGYKKVGLTITPHASGEVEGFIITVDTIELAHLDQYEDVPHTYRRERLTINNEMHWVYINNPGAEPLGMLAVA
jgi:gamma-glutamylcyclotransferase (GGCT)/AIG2-like uncharacterized protein YtfP